MQLSLDNAWTPKPIIQSISQSFFSSSAIEVDVLRLDLLHPQISGNKWFKLKYNLLHAKQNGFRSLLSFGGAYSNHLHALAYAGKLFSISTIGIVRGYELQQPFADFIHGVPNAKNVISKTLQDCHKWGMQLHFTPRDQYRKLKAGNTNGFITENFPIPFIIPEGGNNALGRKGCGEILIHPCFDVYHTICCPVGSGTTLAGLQSSLRPHQQLLGFSALKNAIRLEEEIRAQLTNDIDVEKNANWKLIHDYPFGGFGKTTNDLFQFMEEFKTKTNITLDKVYTAKMMFGITDMLSKNVFARGAKILVIHTGGLQGN
jgi:1-aminocyclopropane-1-carboxylate deaminase